MPVTPWEAHVYHDDGDPYTVADVLSTLIVTGQPGRPSVPFAPSVSTVIGATWASSYSV